MSKNEDLRGGGNSFNEKSEYEELVTQQVERKWEVSEESLPFQPYVHRVSPNSDSWRCDYCKYRDDRWGMAKHFHTSEEMTKGPRKRKD